MAHQPLVSCVMIFWNAENFITEAIDSIFAQTYDHWELLLVDDGSNNGSTAIARQYATLYPDRVRYLEHAGHQNRGMSATRNLGIGQARGAYVAFLDADDVWLPDKLAQQVEIFHTQPEADMVYGRTLIWHSWTGNPEDGHRDYLLDLGVPPDTLVQPPTLFFLLLQNQVQTPTTCNAILRRQVFDRVGGFVESFRGMYEDQAFFAKVHLQHAVFVAAACWARYRQHPASCSASAQEIDYAATRLPLLNWLAEYVTARGLHYNPRIWRALQSELWACRHPQLQRLRAYPGRLRGRARRLLQRVVGP